MKILFVAKESIMHERLGIMQLSSCLKSAGNEVKFILFEKAGRQGLLNAVKAWSPGIIAYSAMTGEHIELLRINELLKKHHSFISVFGGPHATFFPDLINAPDVDAVCVGEGDLAFPDFCRRIDCGENYRETPNFIVKHAGGISRNPIRPLIEDLDSLPFADRELMYEADPDLESSGQKTVFASRGCPYKCGYCFNRKYNELYRGKGQVVRFRSPENLIEELSLIKKKHPLNVLHIDDDTFLLKPKDWFTKFSGLYKDKVNIPFSCNVRADVVREEIIAVLKAAGLDSAWMGVECGNEEIANNVLGRNLKTTQLLTAARILKKHMIKLITQNLVGIPVADSYKTDLETLDLNIKIAPTYAWASILYPYPGTKVAGLAEEHGFIDQAATFLETNKRYTMFKFPGNEKIKIENLHKLFAVIVRLPFLRRFCTPLCRLNLGVFYTGIFYFWYGYSLKTKIFPFRSFFAEIPRYLRLWLKFIRKG